MYTWLYDLKASDWILVLKPGISSNTYDALSSITIRRTQNVHIGITYKVLAVISFRNNTNVVTRGVIIQTIISSRATISTSRHIGCACNSNITTMNGITPIVITNVQMRIMIPV